MHFLCWFFNSANTVLFEDGMTLGGCIAVYFIMKYYWAAHINATITKRVAAFIWQLILGILAAWIRGNLIV